MKIHLVTPAQKQSKNGNRTSALRWASILREQGHRVRVETDYNGEVTDLVIALHAWRSAAAISRYRQRYPAGPLVVALGGTDVNSYLQTDPQTTLRSMQLADALVCLHDLVATGLPAELHRKLFVIHQSARELPRPRQPRKRYFDVCVIGHLRAEKDPLRSALAARQLAPESKLRIIHLGKAHSQAWADKAHAEMCKNPRYLWKGEVSAGRVRQELARTRLMILSSNQEGGANVISEAVVAKTPIIASDIAGNKGLLGDDFPGYFAVGNTLELAQLMRRAETDPEFIPLLQQHGDGLAPKFSRARESAAWSRLLALVR